MSTFVQNLRYLFKGQSVPAINPVRLNALLEGKEAPELTELILLSDFFGITIDRLLRRPLDLNEKAGNIRMVIFDVDGVLTDGGMYYTESGDEFKKFNTKDGLAMRRLAQNGIITGIISHGINRNLIERRAALLNVQKVYVGNTPKVEIANEWCKELNIIAKQVAYIGDDVNDLPLMRLAGFTACPNDAVDEIRAAVDIVLERKGGEACVREWIDKYLLV